jgi:hypothetical protein
LQRWLIDLRDDAGRFIGPFRLGASISPIQINASPVDLSGISGVNAGNVYLQTSAAAADGARGGHIGFSRLDGGRRGAAIFTYQDGANARQMGIGFAYGANSTATDAIIERWKMQFNGNFQSTTSGAGIVLISPDGATTRTISIDNSGNLVVS